MRLSLLRWLAVGFCLPLGSLQAQQNPSSCATAPPPDVNSPFVDPKLSTFPSAKNRSLAPLPEQKAPVVETSPSLLTDVKSWATLPHPDQKVPFVGGDKKPEGFLGAFDPPLPVRDRSGWFGEIGFAALSPRLAGTRTSNTFAPIFPGVFPTLETVGINRAYGPEVLFGYRNPGVGELKIRYQGVYAEKSDSFPVTPQVPFALANSNLPIDQIIQLNSVATTRYLTRFRINTLDGIASTDNWTIWPRWDFKFEGGVRFASFFLEDRGNSRLINQLAKNSFDGFGPLLGIDLKRQILGENDGFLAWIHARVEGSYLFGDATQTLEESFSSPVALIRPNRVRASEAQATPRIAGEVGFSFADLPSHHVRGTIGYRYDDWFEVGKSNGSNFDLVLQGAFVRIEWRY